LTIAALLAPALFSGGAPTLAGPSLPRAAHTATLLPSGEVLVAGGCTADSCELDDGGATTELFDPVTERFRPGPRLVRPRVGHGAARLRDGSVLVFGGWTGAKPTASAELLRPGASRFVDTGRMAVPRGGFASTLLRDGRVLVVGGSDGSRALASAEVYDPRSGRWSQSGSMAEPRTAHTATRLPDGGVVVAGGSGGGGVLARVELWRPETGRFTPLSPLATARHKHAAVLVRHGVLVVGGSTERDFAGRLASAELYDTRLRRFVAVQALPQPRFKIADAVVHLPGGRALVAGGAAGAAVYDPVARRFSNVLGSGQALSFSTATRLPDGRVLVVGGYDGAIHLVPGAWLLRV
jgi:hypothetical protein